jgi:hypothetical protein
VYSGGFVVSSFLPGDTSEIKRLTVWQVRITLISDILNNPDQKCPISDGSFQGTRGELRANTGDKTSPEDFVMSRVVTSGGG